MSAIYCQCLTQHIQFIPHYIIGYTYEGIYSSFVVALVSLCDLLDYLNKVAVTHKIPFTFVERDYITACSTIYNTNNELEKITYTNQQIKIKDFTKFWEEQHTRHQIAQLMRITE